MYFICKSDSSSLDFYIENIMDCDFNDNHRI